MPKGDKKDWKVYQDKIAGWQENYMGRLNKEYIAILSEEGVNPSEKFWNLWDRIRNDKKSKGVIVHRDRFTYLDDVLLSLLQDGAITDDDLNEFSEELQESVRYRNGERLRLAELSEVDSDEDRLNRSNKGD